MKLHKENLLVINTNKNADHVRIANEIYDQLCRLYKVNFSQKVDLKSIRQHDIIVLPSPSPINVFILFLCVILRKRIHIGIHDVEGHERSDKKKVFLYNLVVSKLASGIIVFSEFSKRQLIQKFKPNGVVFKYLFSAAKLASDTDKFDFNFTADYLYFGRANEYSGRNNLEQLVKSLPNRTFLLMGIGLPSHLKHYANVKIIKRKFSDGELHDALCACHTVIFPYNSATQSGGIPLAIAYNCNIIYFDVGGLCDQVGSYPAKKVKEADFVEFTEELAKCNGKICATYAKEWTENIYQQNQKVLVSF